MARERDVRLSTHPGQMGLGEEAVVVLHVGSATGGVAASLDRFLAGFELLSDAARARLGIENDDRSFGLADVRGQLGEPAAERRAQSAGGSHSRDGL